MADAEKTTDDIIEDIAANPKRVRGDSGELEEHPIPDLIALKKFQTSSAAAKRRGFPLRLFRTSPPGADR